MDLLTTSEAAERLSISVSTVQRMVRSGDLRAIRLGRRLRFDPAEVEFHVPTRRQPNEPAAETPPPGWTAQRQRTPEELAALRLKHPSLQPRHLRQRRGR